MCHCIVVGPSNCGTDIYSEGSWRKTHIRNTYRTCRRGVTTGTGTGIITTAFTAGKNRDSRNHQAQNTKKNPFILHKILLL